MLPGGMILAILIVRPVVHQTWYHIPNLVKAKLFYYVLFYISAVASANYRGCLVWVAKQTQAPMDRRAHAIGVNANTWYLLAQ